MCPLYPQDVTPSQSGAEQNIATSLVIHGGLLVTAEKQWSADIRIRAGKIVEIGQELKSDGQERVLDAHGMQVLPGGIDPHTHLAVPFVDDYLSGSQAALAGGITTIGCMIWDEAASFFGTINKHAKLVAEQAIADIFLNMGIHMNFAKKLEELPKLVEAGYTSIKIFMLDQTFEDYQEQFTEIIGKAGQSGLLTLLHCEDFAALQEAICDLTRNKQVSLRYYAESRPVSSEVKAVERAVAICEKTQAPVYLVHISSKAALDVCRNAKKQGLPVYVETRPIYLYFTKEKYLQPDGPLYVGQPPLREVDDVTAIWEGLTSGLVDTLGSDHAPWTRAQKMDCALNIANLRPGVADLQTMLPVFYSEGVMQHKISLERFVALTSTNAAKLFGLFPRKGTIAVGSDADLVIWDPNETRQLQQEELLSRTGFSLHDGQEITGWPKITLRRGQIVYENGKVVGLPGSGQLPTRVTYGK